MLAFQPADHHWSAECGWFNLVITTNVLRWWARYGRVAAAARLSTFTVAPRLSAELRRCVARLLNSSLSGSRRM